MPTSFYPNVIPIPPQCHPHPNAISMTSPSYPIPILMPSLSQCHPRPNANLIPSQCHPSSTPMPPPSHPIPILSHLQPNAISIPMSSPSHPKPSSFRCHPYPNSTPIPSQCHPHPISSAVGIPKERPIPRGRTKADLKLDANQKGGAAPTEWCPPLTLLATPPASPSPCRTR